MYCSKNGLCSVGGSEKLFVTTASLNTIARVPPGYPLVVLLSGSAFQPLLSVPVDSSTTCTVVFEYSTVLQVVTTVLVQYCCTVVSFL